MMNMETEIKWAEVAHYYAAAGIEISLIPYTIDQFMTGGVEVNKGIYTSSAFYKGGGCAYKTGTGYSTADTGKYLPILRAYEDMTPKQLAEVAELDGWEFYSNGEELRGFMNSDGTYGEVSKGNKNAYLFTDGRFTPAQVHKMTEMGIDVFGLIKSGQAIRKSIG